MGAHGRQCRCVSDLAVLVSSWRGRQTGVISGMIQGGGCKQCGRALADTCTRTRHGRGSLSLLLTQGVPQREYRCLCVCVLAAQLLIDGAMLRSAMLRRARQGQTPCLDGPCSHGVWHLSDRSKMDSPHRDHSLQLQSLLPVHKVGIDNLVFAT